MSPHLVNSNGTQPLSPQDYSRGLMYRAMAGGAILVIGIVPLVLAGGDGMWSWFAEPLIGDLSRAIGWLILMAAIEATLIVSYVLRSAPRVRAWNQQHGSTCSTT
ncbi:hypothetical protein [Microlunatus soli]|uniref:Uncharacterized protein n=1 Tax=Microlunatus soli TaxID=630515 RepID=A0A1H1M6C9_9ACTN|nr:hypothetical protein [Microlunatus soli]SDR82316.1 hypothetical protein SAMN04489812_0018 [Microlunatus soli]